MILLDDTLSTSWSLEGGLVAFSFRTKRVVTVGPSGEEASMGPAGAPDTNPGEYGGAISDPPPESPRASKRTGLPSGVVEGLTLFVAAVQVLIWGRHVIHEGVIVCSCFIFIGNYRRYQGERRGRSLLGMALAVGLAAFMMVWPTSQRTIAKPPPPTNVSWRLIRSFRIGAGLRAPAVTGRRLWALDLAGTVELPTRDDDPGVPSIEFPTHAPGSALAVGDGVVATVRAGHVTTRNQVTGQGVHTSSIATGLGPIAVGLGSVWAPDRAESKIYRMTLPDLRATEVAVPGAPNGLVLADRSLWVSTDATKSSPGYLVRIDASRHLDANPRPLPNAGKLLAFIHRTFWISVSVPGRAQELLRWSIRETPVGRPIILAAPIVGIVATGTTVFVLERNRQLVAINAKNSREISATTIHQPDVSGIAVWHHRLAVTSSRSGKLTELGYVPVRDRSWQPTARPRHDP